METLQRLPAENQHHGQQDQQHGNAEGDPGGRTLAQDEETKPECASGHQQENAGTREIENDRGHENGKPEEPDDPALSAMPDVILSAGQNHDGGEAEEIGGLITVWETARTRARLCQKGRAV